MQRSYKGNNAIPTERLIRDNQPASLPDLLIWAQSQADAEYLGAVDNILFHLNETLTLFIMPGVRQTIRNAKTEHNHELVTGLLAEEIFAKWQHAYEEYGKATKENGSYRWIAQLDFLWNIFPDPTLVDWEYLEKIPGDVNFD